MTGLFRMRRDDSRWKVGFLTVFSIIALAYLPITTAQKHRKSSQPAPNIPNHSKSEAKQHVKADDILRDRTPHSSQMTTKQLEQARARLIKRGLSPMQADTVLPMGALP